MSGTSRSPAPTVEYKPVRRFRSAPGHGTRCCRRSPLAAKRPVLYVGQGVHYAKAWPELKAGGRAPRDPGHDQPRRQERLPGDPPAVLGSGGVAMPKAVFQHVQDADVVFGVGASFTATGFGIRFPTSEGQDVHTFDDRSARHQQEHPDGLSARRRSELTLATLIEAVKERLEASRAASWEVTSGSTTQKDPWLAEWMPRLTSDDQAAVALSRDPGLHDTSWTCRTRHHPRCRQPAR